MQGRRLVIDNRQEIDTEKTYRTWRRPQNTTQSPVDTERSFHQDERFRQRTRTRRRRLKKDEGRMKQRYLFFFRLLMHIDLVETSGATEVGWSADGERGEKRGVNTGF